jgi:DNA modification methylase
MKSYDNFLNENIFDKFKKATITPEEDGQTNQEKMLTTYSNENELVLDNTCGSGTSGVACKNTDRNFILMEKDPKYFNISRNRVYDNERKLDIKIKKLKRIIWSLKK